VCAPSNIAVDQLTEKIHKTGLKVSTLLIGSHYGFREGQRRWHREKYCVKFSFKDILFPKKKIEEDMSI